MSFLGAGPSDPGASLLIALLVGHVIGDFLLQTERLAAAKDRRCGALVGHGALVLAAHLLLAAPFLRPGLAVGLVAVSAAHLGADAVRTRLGGKWGGGLAGFFVDQAFHAAVVVVLWAIVVARPSWWTAGPMWSGPYVRGLVLVGAYALNGRGGTAIVRKTLERYPTVVPRGTDGRSEYAMGRVIGCLERFLILTLLLFGQWGAVGFVVAAKSIARFPELRERGDKDFTEYYLIGTLTSILVAVGTGALVRVALG